ncbi:MAG: SDR family oxidoreductase [Burkholderiales bacterium]|nr:SDR family oxidoreductase [Burkholderiales bacterium]
MAAGTPTDPAASLRDRVVVITGGGRGLGLAMARALARAGCRVAISGARDGADLAAAAAELGGIAGAGRVLARRADVASWEDCQALAGAVLERFGRIDALVNNAGRGMLEISPRFNTEPALFWTADPQGVRNIVDANVLGPFLMARACTPHMVAQGFGRIVNISTSLPTMVRKGYSPYGPSKAALEAMTAVWARDLDGTGVTVNALLPGGATDTRLLPGSGPGRRGADGQLLAPELMAAPIVWLVSDASAASNGARYIARDWDPALPADQAAARARGPAHAVPAIL